MNATRIKICGLFRPEDTRHVNAAMPDYVGFVFCKKSRRYINPSEAQKLRAAISKKIISVGVFVDAPLTEIADLRRSKAISIVQLHGGESEDYIKELRLLLPKTEIWKAFKIEAISDLEAAAKSSADKVLLDNGKGTGVCFEWSIIKKFPREFILAGGLTHENIPGAISRFQPYAVDLSSGVETDGVKDSAKILSAVKAAKRGP